MLGFIGWWTLWLVLTVGTVTAAAVLLGLFGSMIGFTVMATPGFERTARLNCPHCGEETPANRPECRFCKRSFRDPVDPAPPRSTPG